METQELREMFSVESTSVQEAARSYLAARVLKEEVEAMLKRQAEILQSAESALLDIMEQAKVLAVKVDSDNGPVTLSASKQVFYSVPSGTMDNDDFRYWLEAMGAADCIKRTVHPQTFASLCRELVERGEKLRPEVKMAEKKTIKIRRE